MNFNFYILGTPNSYNQYPADNNSTVFQEFAQSNTTESQLTVKRSGQLIYYVYMRRLQEKSSNFLGFCLVFNGIYCRNPKKFFNLFDRAFYDTQLKGQFVKFNKGNAIYIIDKFAEKPLEYKRLEMFFKSNLESDSTYDFTNLPSAFEFGSGSKTISVKENDIDILNAIAEFEVVHISNSEKTLSELERTQKILTDLYAEKQKLEQDYNKLVSQKKQYKVVLLLCLIVIGCTVGLFAFNKIIQTKDSQISNLNSKIDQQQIEIKKLKVNVKQLQVEHTSLTNKNTRLTYEVSQLSNQNSELTEKNEQLYSEISNKDVTISNLQLQNNQYRYENSNLQSKNRSLESDINQYKKYKPQTYKVISKTDYYYKLRCNASYEKTNCYTSAGGYIIVYMIVDDYALTEYGWTKLSNLSKQQ
jgi:hypothetical protein